MEIERAAHVREPALAQVLLQVGTFQHLADAFHALDAARDGGQHVHRADEHVGQRGEVPAHEHHVAGGERQNPAVGHPAAENQAQQAEFREHDPGRRAHDPILPVEVQPGFLHLAEPVFHLREFVVLDGVGARDRDHVEHPQKPRGQPLEFASETGVCPAQAVLEEAVQPGDNRRRQ